MRIITEAEALARTRAAIGDGGVLKEIAYRVGMRRRWRGHQILSEELVRIDAWQRTLRRWVASVCHQLDPDHPFQWSLADHLIAVEVLGYDPLERPLERSPFSAKRAA